MSYMKSLDEYTSDDLVKELLRRGQLRMRGKCPYCEKELITMGKVVRCTCRFSDTDTYHPVHVTQVFQHRGDY